MPGPKPQVANGRLALFYQGAYKPHRVNLDFDWATIPPTSGTLIQVASGSPIAPTDAATEAANTLKAMFNPATTFGAWIAYWYNAGAWQPIVSGSLGIAGTNGSSDTKAFEGTFTFRDSSYNLDKIVLLEGAFGGLVHQAYGALGSSSKEVVDDFLSTATGKPGRWYLSKAAHGLGSFLYYTQSANKRLRRQEGLG